MTDLPRPCLSCGELVAGVSHCDQCRPPRPDKASPRERGYDSTWKRLSRRARRIQRFCSDCGTVHDLQADHSPEAWRRKALGLPLRLQDVDVVCGQCNRARGAQRPR